MIMKIVFLDGSWVIGDRKWAYYNETPGTHHYWILDSSKTEDGIKVYSDIIGKKVAITIANVRYFVLDFKNNHNETIEAK
jgi:hypothetical protein